MGIYSAYEVSILHDGKVEKVCANWAGVINKIYATLGEENVKMFTSQMQEAQAEMFFGCWVDMSFGVPGYKINVKVVTPKEKSCEKNVVPAVQ